MAGMKESEERRKEELGQQKEMKVGKAGKKINVRLVGKVDGVNRGAGRK